MADSIIYLNGEFISKSQGHISAEERGMLFGDGVYEVTAYNNGTPFAIDRHIKRLKQSLKGIYLDGAIDVDSLEQTSNKLIKLNGLEDANVYWQITRGANSPRSHPFPENINPTVLMICYPQKQSQRRAEKPNEISAITADDRRWRDCWIKSLMLLPNVMAKQQALDLGAGEAILQRKTIVKEGTSANLFIVKNGALHTHPTDGSILGGITRQVLIELASKINIKVHEEPFTIETMFDADEVFICGTTTNVTAVTNIDGKKIADKKAGTITAQLYKLLMGQLHAK